MKMEKVRDGEEGREIFYELRKVDMGVDEDGDPLSTCVVEWMLNEKREKKQQKQPKQNAKTDLTDQAIHEVGLPADMFTLRNAFYRIHGGDTDTANKAWNRALKKTDLKLNPEGKLDCFP
jgi:hypothetical protein